MGYTNSSLYTGDIDYTNIPDGLESYWLIPLSGITVGGQKADLGNSVNGAAIDTGTTLVGGPSAAIAAVYANIPGAQQGTGDYEGYWLYPCSANVQISLNFGTSTKSWPISSRDFQMASINQNTCVGAFFEINNNNPNLGWIIGDTFLKNVYSVYRFKPPSVGFATLAANAQSAFGRKVPTPTIGTSVATARSKSGAGKAQASVAVVAMVLGVFLAGTVV